MEKFLRTQKAQAIKGNNLYIVHQHFKVSLLERYHQENKRQAVDLKKILGAHISDKLVISSYEELL